eukprot:g466.t1
MEPSSGIELCASAEPRLAQLLFYGMAATGGHMDAALGAAHAHAEAQRADALDSVDATAFMSVRAQAVCARQRASLPWRSVKRKAPRTHMTVEKIAARKANKKRDTARLDRVLSTHDAAAEGRVDDGCGNTGGGNAGGLADGERRKQRRGARPGRTAMSQRAEEAASAACAAGTNDALDELLDDTRTDDLVASAWQARYKDEGSRYWDHFYQEKTVNFFKDRHYMREEFPELMPPSVRADPKQWMARLAPAPDSDSDSDGGPGGGGGGGGGGAGGGGGGAAGEPNPRLVCLACDLSGVAVELLRGKPEYAARRCVAFTCDLTDDSDGDAAARPAAATAIARPRTVPTGPWWYTHTPLRAAVAPASVDFLSMIFVLSAVAPERFDAAVSNAAWALRAGGMVLFRDYGRYDLAQLRFPPGRRLQRGCYVRGDGTLSYFFEHAELHALFERHGFETVECVTRFREITNHKRQLNMHRVWVQAKFRKRG